MGLHVSHRLERLSALLARLVFVCAMLTADGQAAVAQGSRHLELVVVDSATGAPVRLADVSATTVGGGPASVRVRIATDSIGHAALTTLADANLLINVHHLGYAPAELRVEAAAGDDTLVVALAPAAAVLNATVTRATAISRQLLRAGFYERRRVGFGAFLDSATLAERKPPSLVSLLRPYLKGCTMIFVDGMRLLGLRDVDISEVVGVEIYHSNTEAPAQFHNPLESQTHCGSIVVWRRI